MSDSYRTQKESVVAARRIKRDAQGDPIYPRIIAKRPSPGDIHPLNRSRLLRLFESLPIEYLYGLKQIELQPRLNERIGDPFALYIRSEKTIRLFSLPTEWRLDRLPPFLRKSLGTFRARIEDEKGQIVVKWRSDAVMSLWYQCEVFVYELGHHFRGQYRHKNGNWGLRWHEEWVADLHARRYWHSLIREYRERRSRTS